MSILYDMFSYPFMLRALIVGMLTSVCAALLGVSLVLKRFSMIGDGLSHVTFGILAFASAFHLAPLGTAVPLAALSAVFLLRICTNSRFGGDAAIAVISSSALAFGIVMASGFGGVNIDIHNYLFGSILAVSREDVWVSTTVSSLVLILFLFFYHHLFAVTFDEAFARASGVSAGLFHNLTAILTALVVVIGMRLMGAMLISSLIVFPGLSAMQLFSGYGRVTLCAAIISLLGFIVGLSISFWISVPTGACIVLVHLLIFCLMYSLAICRRHFIH